LRNEFSEKQHKKASIYYIPPGSVETEIRRGGKRKHHFKLSSFRNMSAEDY